MPTKKAILASAPSKPDKDWQAEDDHRTMQRAGEVMADPKRMQGVRAHHRKVTQNVQALGGMLGAEKAPAARKRKSPKPYTTKRGVSRR